MTNLELQRAVIGSPGFAGGGVDTGYLGRWLPGPGDGDGSESPGPFGMMRAGADDG